MRKPSGEALGQNDKKGKAGLYGLSVKLYGIQYYMKLLEQILSELGADTLKSFSIVPGFGGYFRSVKGVAEYSDQKIVLALKKMTITVEGSELALGKYFEEDVLITGNISGVKID